jgi:cell division septation protein DedD
MSDGSFPRPQRPFFPRPTDPRDRDQPAPDRRGPASDPLSELARLIGQSDPFAPVPPRPAGRDPGGHLPPVAPLVRPPERNFFPPPQNRYAAAQDGRHDDGGHYDSGHDADHQDDAHQGYDQQAPDRQHYESQQYDPRQASPIPRFPPRSPQPDPAFVPAPEPAAYGRREEYAAPPTAPAAEQGYGHGDYYADPAYAQDGEHLGEHPAEQSDHPSGEYAADDGEAEAYSDEDYEYQTEHPDGDHDDRGPPLKRRNTAKIAVAILGLAVFGSAAAFGYRTIFKGGVTGPAPVIRADVSPTKVIPTGDAAGKAINERLSDGSERLVRRDEDPVELRDPSRVGNTGAAGALPTVGAYPSAGAPSSGPPGSLTEPKRVRTVTIRSDQGATSPERTASPTTTYRSPTTSQRAVVPPAPPQSGTGSPLSIAPPGTIDPNPPTRVVTAAPVAPSRAASEGGGYVVQLSAQKSEAEAQASYRAMQAKYSVLNGRQPLIRRKDQGEKGVFYAAQVGPFGTKDDAAQFCDSLKSAGGSCFVQRN